MPDHYREILQNAPLAAFGMVVGQADLLLQQIPMIIKVIAIASVAFTGFYDLKTDIRVIQTEVIHAKDERHEFRTFMSRGDRCTLSDCQEIKQRIGALEAMRMNGK